MQNQNTPERLIRILLAEIFLLAGLFFVGGTLETVLYALSFIAVLTALAGFCPLYYLAHFSTHSSKKASPRLKKILVTLVLLLPVIGGYSADRYTTSLIESDLTFLYQTYQSSLAETADPSEPTDAVLAIQRFDAALTTFRQKYEDYRPFPIKFDDKLTLDLTTMSATINTLASGEGPANLTEVHLTLQTLDPFFQAIADRNDLSLT